MNPRGPFSHVLGQQVDRGLVGGVLGSNQTNSAANEVLVVDDDVVDARKNDTGFLTDGSNGG